MRLWLDVAPKDLLNEPPEELAQKAWRELATWAGAELPIYTTDGLSVRLRLVSLLEDEMPAGRRPPGPAIATAGWYLSQVLEGLLWRDAGQVGEWHIRREWGRLAGLEVTI